MLQVKYRLKLSFEQLFTLFGIWKSSSSNGSTNAAITFFYSALIPLWLIDIKRATYSRNLSDTNSH